MQLLLYMSKVISPNIMVLNHFSQQISEKNSRYVKNFGMWIKYNSRSGTHNMYREYRDTNLNSAIDTLCEYTYIVANHHGNSYCCTNFITWSFTCVSYMIYSSLVIRQRHGWSSPLQKQEYPDHPYRHRGCQGLQESNHSSIPRK